MKARSRPYYTTFIYFSLWSLFKHSFFFVVFQQYIIFLFLSLAPLGIHSIFSIFEHLSNHDYLHFLPLFNFSSQLSAFSPLSVSSSSSASFSCFLYASCSSFALFLSVFLSTHNCFLVFFSLLFLFLLLCHPLSLSLLPHPYFSFFTSPFTFTFLYPSASSSFFSVGRYFIPKSRVQGSR